MVSAWEPSNKTVLLSTSSEFKWESVLCLFECSELERKQTSINNKLDTKLSQDCYLECIPIFYCKISIWKFPGKRVKAMFSFQDDSGPSAWMLPSNLWVKVTQTVVHAPR